MRSRGKGKKPLGNEGKPATGPSVLSGQDEGAIPDPKPIILKSGAKDAYEVLKDILAERRGSWLAGYGRNIRRNNKRGFRWFLNLAVGVTAGTVIGLVTGDLVAAIAAATAGATMPTAVSTAHIRMSRLTAHRSEYPDTPEFRDDWAVTCYEFMLMVNGFNLRIEAMNRLRRMAAEHANDDKADDLDDVADGYAELLAGWRDELVEVSELLASYQKDDPHGGILTDAQTIATIRILDPLKGGRFEWLILDPEIIPPGREHELHERDVREITVFEETNDAIDPYAKMRRELHKDGSEDE